MPLRPRVRFQFMCVIDDRRIFLKTVLDEVTAQCDQFFLFFLKKRAVRSAASENGIPESKMPMVLTFVL
eukprot:scaffold15958_cov72-Skeletonema_dohrnii-CCMP3373.AAC.4